MYDGPNVDPKVVQNVYKAIGSTEGAKRAMDDVAKAEARASEAEAKSRGGPKAYGPIDHLHQRSHPQLLQATQAHHRLLQPAPQRPNLQQNKCQHRQNHLGLLPRTNHNQHLNGRRNALTDPNR